MSDEFYHDFWACIDAGSALSDLDRVEGKRKEVEAELERTNQKSEWTFFKARTVAMQGYHMLVNFLEMAGIHIPKVVQAIASGAISVGTALYTIATAEAVTPFMQVQAILTFIAAASAIYASTQAEEQGKLIGSELNQALRNVNSMIGGFMYL